MNDLSEEELLCAEVNLVTPWHQDWLDRIKKNNPLLQEQGQ